MAKRKKKKSAKSLKSKHESYIIGIFFALIIIFFIILFATQQTQPPQSQPIAQVSLSELQIDACNIADKAGTCNSRLPEVGIVLKEDCCSALGKCC